MESHAARRSAPGAGRINKQPETRPLLPNDLPYKGVTQQCPAMIAGPAHNNLKNTGFQLLFLP